MLCFHQGMKDLEAKLFFAVEGSGVSACVAASSTATDFKFMQDPFNGTDEDY